MTIDRPTPAACSALLDGVSSFHSVHLISSLRRHTVLFQSGPYFWLARLLSFKRPLLSVSVCVCVCVGNFDAKYLGN